MPTSQEGDESASWNPLLGALASGRLTVHLPEETPGSPKGGTRVDPARRSGGNDRMAQPSVARNRCASPKSRCQTPCGDEGSRTPVLKRCPVIRYVVFRITQRRVSLRLSGVCHRVVCLPVEQAPLRFTSLEPFARPVNRCRTLGYAQRGPSHLRSSDAWGRIAPSTIKPRGPSRSRCCWHLNDLSRSRSGPHTTTPTSISRPSRNHGVPRMSLCLSKKEGCPPE